MHEWADAISSDGWSSWWIYGTVAPVALLLAAFLGWVAIFPHLTRRESARQPSVAPTLPAVRYRRIGVAVEFEGSDDLVLSQAVALARIHEAEMVVVHVVEGLGAQFHGVEADDEESRADRLRMAQLVAHLENEGIKTNGVLGFGAPADELVRIATSENMDLLVLGTHGHRFIADLALGQTVSPVIHRLKIPVLVVPTRPPAPQLTRSL